MRDRRLNRNLEKPMNRGSWLSGSVFALLVVAAGCGTGSRISDSSSGTSAGGASSTSSVGGGDASGANSSSTSTNTSSSASGANSGSSGSGMPTCPGPKVADPDKLGLKACPSYVCPNGGGHCVPNALVPADVMDFLDFCNKDSMCVPDPMIETQGNFLLKTCTAIMGLEGRCVSSCIPRVRQQEALLEQDICDVGELCVPCYEPINNESTFVCEMTCDMPVDPQPDPLPKCCGGRGLCLPGEIVPDEAKDALGKDSCPNSTDLCTPTELIDDQGNGQICQSSFLFMLLGVDTGVCVPNCVPAAKGIPQGSCPSGYNCAPCDVFGVPTGACGDDW